MKKGKCLDNELKASHITKDDLLTEMRIRLGSEDLETIKEAVLERNGKVSAKGIELNRKVLADLAMNNPEAFKAVVDAVK